MPLRGLKKVFATKLYVKLYRKAYIICETKAVGEADK